MDGWQQHTLVWRIIVWYILIYFGGIIAASSFGSDWNAPGDGLFCVGELGDLLCPTNMGYTKSGNGVSGIWGWR